MIRKIYTIFLVLFVLSCGCSKKVPYSLSWSFRDNKNSYLIQVFNNDLTTDKFQILIIRGHKDSPIGCRAGLNNEQMIVTIYKPFYKEIECSKNDNLLLVDKNKIIKLHIDRIDYDYIKHLMKDRDEIKKFFLLNHFTEE